MAVGCLAERYGAQLAEALPEADAVLGFDDYADIGARLRRASSAGEHPEAHAPRDRRLLLPITPVEPGRRRCHATRARRGRHRRTRPGRRARERAARSYAGAWTAGRRRR